jgi:hypothetical protein
MSAGHGGQVLLSRTTHDLVEYDLPDGVDLRDLGEHRLKDLQRPSHSFDLCAPGWAPAGDRVGRGAHQTPATTGLLARPGQRLQLLTGGARDAPARQQTLRNTIAWSYQLLDIQEQQLLRRVSVFVGGCTLEAIEALCTALETSALTISVVDGIASLLDKSLLQRREQEHYNLRAALEWALEQGTDEQAQERRELALRLSALLEPFWAMRGPCSEACTFLERALAQSEGRVILCVPGSYRRPPFL